MRRLAAAAAVLAAAATAAGPLAAPRSSKVRLPWSVRVEVFYSGERNKAEYLEDIKRRVERALIACDAFTSVVLDGPADLETRVAIDLIDINEDRVFTGAPTGGPGEFVRLGATVTIAGDLAVVTAADEKVVMTPKKFYHGERAESVLPGDDPQSIALDRACDLVVRWTEKYLCRGRLEIQKTAAPLLEKPPASPSEEPSPRVD